MKNQKKAIVTGITGQDGTYLCKLLLDKGYLVYGTYRRTSSVKFWRLKELNLDNHPNLELHSHDLTDLGSTLRLVEKIEPNEIYNLAAQSFVKASFDQPITTAEISGLGAVNFLEAIRIVNPKIKFYQASTSEMFGLVQEIPQSENTPFYPRSPYGCAKLYAHWMTINYRESFNIFASSGILFNHESPLRGLEFVTRKITDSLTKIKLGKQSYLELGNLNAKRDWGYALDYVEGMWRMLQAQKSDTFVLATGETQTVRKFVEMVCEMLDINITWEGEGSNEIGIDVKTNKKIIRVNPEFYRPAEVDILVGDYSKAKDILGWSPKTSLQELCQIMVKAELARYAQ